MKLKRFLIVQWQKVIYIQLLFDCYYLRRLFQKNNLEQKNLQGNAWKENLTLRCDEN